MTGVETLLSAIAALQRADLDRWIAEALVTPDDGAEGGAPAFSDMACARVRLLCTLRYELEMEHEAMVVALSLMDQLYDARRKLRALAEAVATQEPEVQAAIVAALRRRDPDAA